MKLDTSISKLPLVGPVYVKRLQNLNIFTIEDLILHIPHRYSDFRNIKKIKGLKDGEKVTVQGKVVSMKNIYTRNRKIKMTLALSK